MSDSDPEPQPPGFGRSNWRDESQPDRAVRTGGWFKRFWNKAKPLAAEGGRMKGAELGIKYGLLGVLTLASAFDLSLGPFQDPIVDMVAGTAAPVLALAMARGDRRRSNASNPDDANNQSENERMARLASENRQLRTDVTTVKESLHRVQSDYEQLKSELRDVRDGQQALETRVGTVETDQIQVQTTQRDLQTGQQALETGQQQLQAGQQQLDGGLRQLHGGLQQVQQSQQQLGDGQQQLQRGLGQVRVEQGNLRSDLGELGGRTSTLETENTARQQETGELRADVDQQSQDAVVRDQAAADQSAALGIVVDSSASVGPLADQVNKQEERLRTVERSLDRTLRQVDALRTENAMLRTYNAAQQQAAQQQAGAGPTPPPPGPDPNDRRGARRGAPTFTPADRIPPVYGATDQGEIDAMSQEREEGNARLDGVEGQAAGQPPVNPADRVDPAYTNPNQNRTPPGGPTGPRR